MLTNSVLFFTLFGGRFEWHGTNGRRASLMQATLGIGDIGVHIPRPKIPLNTIIARHRRQDPQRAIALEHARGRTGQVSIRFPHCWEDTATMAAQAAAQLLVRLDAAAVASLRYLVVGTETGIDQAKPIAAYVHGMLQRAGFPISQAISTFDVKHACAGGAIALLSVGAMLGASRAGGERGLIICTDEARYAPGSKAEITQGAAAVAILAEPAPRLLAIDLGEVGYSSHDVDDFFRPLGSLTAQVKGRFSIECYQTTVEEALLDLCARTGRSMPELLVETDLFALHVPFRSLPEETMADLVQRYLGTDSAATSAFLARRHFKAGTEPAAVVGNVYTGAMFLSLAALLAARCRELQSAVVGNRITMAAYGSGNTALAFSGRVSRQAPAVIRGWSLDHLLNHGQEASMADYDAWVAGRRSTAPGHGGPLETEIPARSFYLQEVRADGYRVYGLRGG